MLIDLSTGVMLIDLRCEMAAPFIVWGSGKAFHCLGIGDQGSGIVFRSRIRYCLLIAGQVLPIYGDQVLPTDGGIGYCLLIADRLPTRYRKMNRQAVSLNI